MRKRWLAGAALLTLVFALLGAGGAGAADPVVFVGTQTLPVPPASNYAGTGGGDGWAVAHTPRAVWNVFHHSSVLQLACHLQSDASSCWDDGTAAHRPLTVVVKDDANNNFAVSGQPGLWMDHTTEKLYVFGTRWGTNTADSVVGPTGGVVCIDTKIASPTANPFCGFTQLTAPGESIGQSTTSGISDPVVVGSRWFAFNFVGGSGVASGTGHTRNTLLCFELATSQPCTGQPFTVAVSPPDGTVSAGSFPAPSIAAIGNQVIIPMPLGGSNQLACFNGATLSACGGSWPAPANQNYFPSSYGAPFPMLTPAGAVNGFCLPAPTIPCYDLAGGTVATPVNMATPATASDVTAIYPTSGWNGPAVTVGPRVYVPNGNRNEIDCYDYNLQKSCPIDPEGSFPKHINSLSLLYTVNDDFQRPGCLWVNADNGTQIQNFDAFSGGACGSGPIRVFADTFVVATPLCTPGSYTSLQVTSPARSAYTSGSVTFVDGSGVALPGTTARPLDDTGTVSLSGLTLSNGAGLPQFLITLVGADSKPTEVGVKLTWTGTFDPSCATKPGTTVANPPTTVTPTTPSAPPAQANAGVTLTPPSFGRAGAPLTFLAAVKNTGSNATQGVILRVPVPSGVTVDSVTTDTGTGCATGPTLICYIGTLGSGATANVKMVLRKAAPGALTLTASVEDDHDTDPGNNNTSATTTVVGPNDLPPAPPAPSQPGTFNAIPVGTVLVNGVPVPADQPLILKSGDIVDVTNGAVVVTSAQGWVGVFSSQKQPRPRILSTRKADGVLPAIFQITQTTAPDDPVLLTLQGGDFNTCTTPRRLSATNTSPVRALWGSARGTFRTKARYSSATVRGTIWLTQDRCDGSYTQVDEGVVDVQDDVLNKTVTLNAGQSYVAASKTAVKKPPAQKKAKKKKVNRKKAAPNPTFYLVRTGDSLSSIATAKLGRENRWAEIAKLNGLRPPYHVEPGTKLKLPRG